MTHEHAHDRGQPPRGFGPAETHFSDKTEERARGWQEPVEGLEAARTPRLRPVAEHNRAPLAERFRQRVREAAAEAGESTEGW